MPLTLEARSLNHWTTKEVPDRILFILSYFICVCVCVTSNLLFLKYNIYCIDGLIQKSFSSHFDFGSTM